MRVVVAPVLAVAGKMAAKRRAKRKGELAANREKIAKSRQGSECVFCFLRAFASSHEISVLGTLKKIGF